MGFKVSLSQQQNGWTKEPLSKVTMLQTLAALLTLMKTISDMPVMSS